MGIGVRLVAEAHLLQQPLRLFLVFLRCAAPQQVRGQGDVFQYGILGEKVKVLEYQAEMEPVFPCFRLALGKKLLSVYPDLSLIGGFQEV